jgi:hypothetical protein
MSLQFDRLMTHELTIRKRNRNWQGDFVDIVTFPGEKGFVQYGKKLVTNQKGEEVMASAVIFLKRDAPVDSEYEYWMIDQTAPYARENMEVIIIDPVDDPRTGKRHHYEVAVR